jgi:hypothetical protein
MTQARRIDCPELWFSRVARSTIALLLALSSVACGDKTGNSTSQPATDGGGSDAATQFTQYCSQLASAVCATVASCCNLTMDACRSAYQKNCLTTESEFSNPGVQFNAASGQQCIAGIASSFNGCAYAPTSSQEYQAELLACRSLVVGTLAVGSECTTSGACAVLLGYEVSCSADSGSIKRCTEAPLSDRGGACGGSTFGSCANGLYCDLSATPTQCAALKANGATCRYPTECLSQVCTNSACVEPNIALFCQSLASS